jgi:hypothetical protein
MLDDVMKAAGALPEKRLTGLRLKSDLIPSSFPSVKKSVLLVFIRG